MAERVAVTPKDREMLIKYTREQVAKWNASNDVKLDPDTVVGLFAHESQDFNPYAKSPTGAAGIAQFTEGTGAEYGLSPEDRYNPLKAIPAGIAHFAKGVAAFPESRVDQIRAYNAGIQGTRDYLAGKPIADKDRAEEIKNFPLQVVAKIKQYSTDSAQPEARVQSASAAQPASATQNPAPPPQERQMIPSEDHYDENSMSTGETLTALRDGAVAMARLGKGAADYFTQFPREAAAYIGDRTGITQLGQRAGTAVGDIIGNAIGLPDKGPMPPQAPPQIDPTGMLNFVTLPLGMGSGRLVNAGVGAIQAFYQDLDARARNAAQAEGVDWNTLGFGERASRIVDQLNWAAFDDKMAFNMAAGAFFGGMFGGKPTEPGDLSGDISLIRTPVDPAKMTKEELHAYEAAKAGAEKARITNLGLDMEDAANEDAIRAYHEGLPRAIEWNKAAAEHNTATQAAYASEVAAAKSARDISEVGVHAENVNRAAAYDDQVRRLEAPYQAALERHNAMIDALQEKAGVPRLPDTAGGLEKAAYNQRLKAKFTQEIGLPAEDPSTAVYQGWLGSRETGYTDAALREAPKDVVEMFNAQLDAIAKEGTAQDALGAKLTKLGRRLDYENIPIERKIADLQDKMSQLTPSDPRWQAAAEKVKELQTQLKPVRIIDLVDRAQAIAKAQRSVLFKDAANANEARLINDAKEALYGGKEGGGIIESALSAEEAATWRKANALSRDYRIRDRQAQFVANAFGDVRNGASNIRNRLAAKQKSLVRSFGKERYDELLDLARTLDDLNAKAPPVRPPSTAYPRKPEKLKVNEVLGPKPKVPRAPEEIPYLDIPREPAKITYPRATTPSLPDYDPSRRYKIDAFINGLNSVFGASRTERALKILAAPPAIAYTYQNAGTTSGKIVLAGMSVELLRTLLSNRVARREFSVMAAHLNNMTSTQFSKAFAKFATAVEVQKLHEQEAGVDQEDNMPTPVEQAVSVAAKLPPPAPENAKIDVPPGLPIPTRRTGMVAAQ